MHFPIEFVRKVSNCDWLGPTVNIAGNAAVLAGVGITTSLVAKVAIQFFGITGTLSTAIVVTPIVLSIGCAIVAVGGVAVVVGLPSGIGYCRERWVFLRRRE